MDTVSNRNVRIEYLDGMRGVAILLVVLFHAYARWPLIVPYGNIYGEFFLARYGWLGVELFFMISGFVIYMSLERCASFSEFIQRRWLRLFPAMFLVSMLIYFSAGLLHERPAGIPKLADIVPGLLFIEPSWISKFFGIQQGVLEGAFWSLFVEVKFYILFGGLFFIFGSRIAKASLLLAFIGAVASAVCVKYFESEVPGIRYFNTVLSELLSFNFASWFLVGVLTFDLHRRRSLPRLLLTIVVGVLAAAYSSVGHRHDFTGLFALTLVFLFVGSVYSDIVKKVLSSRFLLFIGFISYPFYLFHENFMIAVIVKLGEAFPQIPSISLPLIPFLLVCGVALVVTKYLEPIVRRQLKFLIDFFQMRTTGKIGA